MGASGAEHTHGSASQRLGGIDGASWAGLARHGAWVQQGGVVEGTKSADTIRGGCGSHSEALASSTNMPVVTNACIDLIEDTCKLRTTTAARGCRGADDIMCSIAGEGWLGVVRTH